MRATKPKSRSKTKARTRAKPRAKAKVKPRAKVKKTKARKTKPRKKSKTRPARKRRVATRSRGPLRSAVESLVAVVEGPLEAELPIDDSAPVVAVDSDAIEILNDTQAMADPEPDPVIIAGTSEDRKRAQILAGGDPDAEWDHPDDGTAAVGGSTPTPDQDIVDDLGRAAGVTYETNEPIAPEDKVAARDEHRWEVDPASSEDYQERLADIRHRKKRP